MIKHLNRYVENNIRTGAIDQTVAPAVNDGLKPCPFCGQGDAGVRDHHGYYSVCCGYWSDGKPSKHCRQDWGEFETEDDAAKAWNRRASC